MGKHAGHTLMLILVVFIAFLGCGKTYEGTTSITLLAEFTALPADGASSTRIAVTVLDVSGEPVPAGTQVHFRTTLGRFNNGSRNYSVMTLDETGILNVSLIAGFEAGVALVTASAAGASQSLQIQIGVIPNPVGSITLNADPLTLPADGRSSTVITAVIVDISGDPVLPNTPVRFETNLGTFANSNAQVLDTFTANETGTIVISLVAGTTSGTAVVVVSAGGVSQSIRIQIGVSAIGSITLTATPVSLPADGSSSSSIQAVVLSSTGAPVLPGTSVTFTTNLGSFGNGQQTTTAETADATGTVTVSLIASTTEGTANVVAAAGGVTQKVNITMGVEFGPVGGITLTAVPPAIPADGSSSTLITATITDSLGSPVEIGTWVRFSVQAGRFSSGGQTISIQTLDLTGTVRVSLISSNDPRVVDVTCEAGNITQVVQVIFGNVSSSPTGSITLVANPESIPADGVSSTTLTATLLGTNGIPMPLGTRAVFRTTRGRFANGGTSTTEILINEAGTVTTALISSTTAGIAVVTVTAGGTTQSVDVLFSSDTGEAGNITLQADPESLPADGVSSTILTATLTAPDGTPMSIGTRVTFTTTLGRFPNGITTIQEILSNNAGTVTTSLIAGTTTGSAQVTVTAGGASQTIIVAFTGPQASGETAFITVVFAGDNIEDDGFSSTTVTATMTDAAGDPVAIGTSVQFTIEAITGLAGSNVNLVEFSNGSDTLTTTTANNDGTATVQVFSSGVGIAQTTAVRVRATSNGIAGIANLQIDPPA